MQSNRRIRDRIASANVYNHPADRHEYRAYLILKNGALRYGSFTFPDVNGALLDAAKIIDACKQDSACEWRNEIKTYGAERV